MKSSSSSRVRDALLEAAQGPAAPAPAMKAMKAALLLFVWFCESPMEGLFFFRSVLRVLITRCQTEKTQSIHGDLYVFFWIPELKTSLLVLSDSGDEEGQEGSSASTGDEGQEGPVQGVISDSDSGKVEIPK